MLERTTIARPYAEAAFAQACEEDRLGQWSATLELLNMIVSDPDMIGIINNPNFTEDQLYQLIVDIGGDQLGRSSKNFAYVLIDAGRITLMPEIAALFEQSRAAVEGISAVDITTAFPLSDAEINGISEAISKHIGKKVKMHTAENKDLIGGIIIQIGDSVIDASLRGHLESLNSMFVQ